MKKYLLYILSVFLLLSCQDSIETPQVVDVNDAPDLAGQAIQFTAGYSSLEAKTRAPFGTADEMQTEVGKYIPAGSELDPGYSHGYNYIYNVEMFKQGETSPVSLGTAQYQLASDGMIKRTDGMLELVFPSDPETSNTPLFWPDNVNGYGFHVTAGNDEISADQNSLEKFFDNDRLEGYGFSPVFTAPSTEDLEALNYHSSKTWYSNNKTWLGEGRPQELYKAVPLFLQHNHAWVSIILKADKGIQRDFLWYENTSHGFNSDMYYYEGSTRKTISNPWRRPWHVDYDKADSNGGVETGNEQNTTMLHAIIEPTNFLEHPENLIGQIKLNGLTFTYAPINDNNYGRWNTYKDATEETINGLGETEAAAIRKALSDMQAYNVTAGKHLKITVTLTTDKIVLITALLEDWDEMFFSSICDDYGNNGDPIIIANREELLAFLSDENKNKAGNTAVISSLSIDLDDDASNTWTAQPLNCTLNLAGCVLHTSGQFLTDIAQSGSLINGEINVNGVKRSNSMNAAVCDNNYGTIEQVSITVDESVRHDVYAKQAGIAAVNWGTVFNCESNLNVLGSTGYIGGIVGESKRNGDDGPLPVVDRCTMNGRVGATGDSFTGVGGIAGYAEYRLSRCAFTYGMTLSQQNDEKYKNIVVATTTDTSLEVDAFGNSWPTTVDNTIGKNATTNANINTLAQYNAVIDSQEELSLLLTAIDHYSGTARYRIADDFSVDESWNLGVGEDSPYEANAAKYNLNFELDGNDKTITTNGTMLFSHINGYFHDFTVYCNKSLIAESNPNATDVMAPLAYSVNKKDGTSGQATLENIKVVMREEAIVNGSTVPGAYVQAAMPSGMIVWAYGDAKVINCEVTADVRVKFSSEFTDSDAKKFAGGIAAASVDATFNGCVVHSKTTISADPNDNPAAIKNHYRGGIVGGVYTKQGYTPGTVIVDCNSWWGNKNTGENYSPTGSLIGATKYDLNNQPTNGIGSGCTGNWWPDSFSSAADIDNTTAAKLLGKRNTITPTEYSGEQY